MKIESDKYVNHRFIFQDTQVCFNQGVAEVPDAVGNALLEAKFPHVFAEGKRPRLKSQIEKAFDEGLSTRDELWKKEVDRLNNVISGLKQENLKLRNEVNMWKAEVEKMHDPKAEAEAEAEAEVVGDVPTEAAEDESDAIKKELASQTKPELIEIAKSLGIPEDNLVVDGKQISKNKLIELILSYSSVSE